MSEMWKAVAAFVGVFIAGSVFGGVFSLGVGQRMISRPRPAQVQPQMLKMYSRELALTEEQQKKVEPIIAKADADLNRLRAQQFDDTRLLLQRVNRQFAAELSPEQRTRLEGIQRRQDELARGRGGRGGPNGGRPGPGRGGSNGFRGGQAPVPAEATPAAGK